MRAPASRRVLAFLGLSWWSRSSRRSAQGQTSGRRSGGNKESCFPSPTDRWCGARFAGGGRCRQRQWLRRSWRVSLSACGAQSFSAAKRLNRSSDPPHSQDDEFGVSFSIPQEDRSLKPVVLSIGRVKAWRRSEVVLAGSNRLAGCDAIQHILCAMPDSRIADLDPDRVRRLDDIVRFCQRKSVTVDELPVGSSRDDATGNPRPTKSPTGDGDRAPKPEGTPPELEYRSNTKPQFEGKLKARRYSCFNHVPPRHVRI